MASYNDTVSDTGTLQEVNPASVTAMLSLSDASAYTEVNPTNVVAISPLSDAFAYVDYSAAIVVARVQELNILQDSAYSRVTSVLRDKLIVATVLRPLGTQTVPLLDRLRLADEPLVLFNYLVADSASLSDVVVRVLDIVRVLRDKAFVIETNTPVSNMSLIVSVTAAIIDAALAGFAGIIHENLQLVISVLNTAVVKPLIDEILSAVDAIEPSFTLVRFTSEALAVTDSSLVKATVGDTLTDSFFSVVVFSDGNDVYTGYVMNNKSFGVTTYSNYNFESFANIGGSTLAAGQDGLFLLGGNSDDGTDITWKAKTGKLNIEAGQSSRIEKMFVGCESSGKVVVKITDDAGKERWYKSITPAAGPSNLPITTGRGVLSMNWQFELTNEGGSDIILEQIELVPVVTRRKRGRRG